MKPTCPNCQSPDVTWRKKKQCYICEDCDHEFVSEKQFEKLRIFLSYGHDRNEELVLQIKKDLEKRGHDVWFDKSDIKVGQDWRRSITDGIMESKRVMYFLSKKSTRERGVCLDEIAIAISVKGGNIQTILVEGEDEVKAPATISHIQWLDMHDWQEVKTKGDEDWNSWYENKFNEIVEVVESEESRTFAGEIEELKGYLNPISSDARIKQLLQKGFIGREWISEKVEKWRTENRESRMFWLLGNPGVGKSAFAANLSHFGKDKVIAAQFVEYDKPDHRNATRVIRSLAFQLATRLSSYRSLLLKLPEIKNLDPKGEAELFEYLLAEPLKHGIDGGQERYLMIIDALDEAKEGERNPLVEMLARHAPRLPDWLGMVVTSRNEKNVTDPLQGLKPFVLDTENEANQNDIRTYIELELENHLQKFSNKKNVIEQILEKSEGVFLYVERVCRDVQVGNLSLENLEAFPVGLGGIYWQFFNRQFPDTEIFEKFIEPMLEVILAARENLPLELLQSIFNWSETELRKWLRMLGSLFLLIKNGDSGIIIPFHKSITDWLTDPDKAGLYYVDIKNGHSRIGNFGYSYFNTKFNPTSQVIDKYFSVSILFHLYTTNNWQSVIECIVSPEIFAKLSPKSYSINSVFYNGITRPYSDSLKPSLLENRILQDKVEIFWKLAYGFAERTIDAQMKVFSFAKRFNIGTNLIRNYLKSNHPSLFDEYRDAMYFYVSLSEIAPYYALLAKNTTDFNEKAKKFIVKYNAIRSHIGYLEKFAGNEGWSGALENQAFYPDEAWEKLISLVINKNSANKKT